MKAAELYLVYYEGAGFAIVLALELEAELDIADDVAVGAEQ
mgnify:CR=1 FL=1